MFKYVGQVDHFQVGQVYCTVLVTAAFHPLRMAFHGVIQLLKLPISS